jgi:hypothetical protein
MLRAGGTFAAAVAIAGTSGGEGFFIDRCGGEAYQEALT